MATLVLVNGSPASGKSTVAAELVNARPLALNLDIDIVRGQLGRWLSQPIDAGLAARDLALAMAQVHLGHGRDVVVPQFLARERFIEQLDATARAAAARFVEIALIVPRSDALARFATRSAAPLHRTHRDAAALQQQQGGPDALGEMYDAFIDLIDKRSTVRRVDVVWNDIAATVDRVEAAIQRT